MTNRWKIAVFLIALVIGSTWLLHRLGDVDDKKDEIIRHDPDYYMENFTTTTMEEDGSLKNRLTADYMAHYPENDTTELNRPQLEVFRKDKQPLMIIADKGWVTSDNEVILLTGAVKIRENGQDGARKMEITTTDVRILTEQEYAETDKPATFTNRQSIITATGVRAFFREERVELLSNVQTTIEPDATN